ncbi:hypothetical protein M406DRAFT_59828 [Cryphonectria parasitica EP155]|uniref:Elongator complex protein 5 n=1 Tax=Cryphonectria parasitica (strain ATCC 38755 / EP155) TaxID=660469 RepID=A0A9P4YCM7_CRYP1|nr:uncharacterized protein M406DRAFT_59828 [Cryphonectria parasitica EP155]KAF3771037.1 hypothetical protein M406DRAFT_59828 [Cryphonectria parasitica EP155]
MAPSAQAHRRSHSLLLFQKLLNLRDSASPLTLVLDTLEQSASPAIQEFILRAKISHTKIIFISFATIQKPSHADILIKARGKSLEKLRSEIVSHCPPPTAPPISKDASSSPKTLLLIDELNPLAARAPRHLTNFLSSLLTHPAISLVATYHADVPLSLRPSVLSEYEPHPFTLLNHLATTILRVSSLSHAIERRRAQDRSLPEPEFGLGEGREGVLIGLRSSSSGRADSGGGGGGTVGEGVVIDMELRRRSGRAVVERFVLMPSSSSSRRDATAGLSLLSDHPQFVAAPEDAGGGDDGEGLADTTFSLGLTEKQRKDRDGIVLPYFDAQTDVGGGEGGRILYEMGREDDFDDEEDEI